MAKKIGPGRPKLPDSEKRKGQFLLKLTDDEMDLVRRAGGDNLSAWIRVVLLRAAKRALKAER